MVALFIYSWRLLLVHFAADLSRNMALVIIFWLQSCRDSKPYTICHLGTDPWRHERTTLQLFLRHTVREHQCICSWRKERQRHAQKGVSCLSRRMASWLKMNQWENLWRNWEEIIWSVRVGEMVHFLISGLDLESLFQSNMIFWFWFCL